MLGFGEYLLGVVVVGTLAGFAWLGAAFLSRRLVPDLNGTPAHLATAVIALVILLFTAELLGSFGLFEPLPYVLAVVGIGVGTWALGRGSCRGGRGAAGGRTASVLDPPNPHATRGRSVDVLTLVALAIAAAATILFALELKPKLSTGMTGFDSTWYHGPFATGFFQSGNTWDLHFIAPQFLAWFYPANSEVFHGVGMLAFDRDILSPLLNLGWLIGCLVASWCIGKPYKVALFSLALGAIALSLPALSDQAGEARNDIVGIFFLLAAVAVAVNAWAARSEVERLSLGAIAVVGLAAGLAAGTKLNFLLPAALVVGLAVIAPRGERWRSLGVTGLSALAGGGYWYLRNLVHTGNPLPWIDDLGPISLPAPDQTLGGREGHSVFGYLADGSVWSDWFLPGLHEGLTVLWPLLLGAALAGLFLCLGRRSDPALRVAGAVGLAAALAWLLSPTSASGPEGIPRGFESGLRYLAPALVLGLALLPTSPQLRPRLTSFSLTSSFPVHTDWKRRSQRTGRGLALLVVGGAVLLVGVGYLVQRHYLESRYTDPGFTTPGLNAAFKWAQGIEEARIATTSTRQYPLFGRDLSNEVDYIGEEQPHGGFTAPITCSRWRELLNAGNYDYVVASRDRIEPGKPPYPATARWTQAPSAAVVLRKPPTIIYKLSSQLDPSACR
ncbi:MAG TPA: hypothetical protein VF093_04890 [Solirubrobacterales bacterium]